MHHYQVVLTQMRSGKSDRQIAKLGLMGRGKCCELRAIAVAHGWLSGALPEAQELCAMLSRSTPASVPSGVEKHREKVLAWVADGIAGTTIFGALKREGLTGSYSAVRRFLQKLPRALNPTVPLDFGPGESAQVDFGAGPTLIEGGRRIKTLTLAFSTRQSIKGGPNAASATSRKASFRRARSRALKRVTGSCCAGVARRPASAFTALRESGRTRALCGSARC